MRKSKLWIALLFPVLVIIAAPLTGGFALFLMPLFPFIGLIILLFKLIPFLLDKISKTTPKPFDKSTLLIAIIYLLIGVIGVYLLSGIGAFGPA